MAQWLATLERRHGRQCANLSIFASKEARIVLIRKGGKTILSSVDNNNTHVIFLGQFCLVVRVDGNKVNLLPVGLGYV